ncbi:LacI family DNA-binding transcriptional regulator [Dinghuibacter silviterrae]|uniref:LacI family transcriptional regulator n=1 Tax=Dinghuibacter silviterrae TaxID=1539049 RepID=A0A4R8DIX5_9BACT|nr:LacI family DNA-binding transcriptional regulator [Dinghuibacter silviterrae]TDW96950.1 LacI family transcriptional regulator [Dinghuibacter silviterrae]
MKKKKVSIYDIAEEVGVSTATVSYVLNGKAAEKRISPELQKQILRSAKKNGYQPNMLAKGLSTGKSKIIGMMVEYISDPFFSTIARQIEDKASRRGYKLLYSSTENCTDKTKELLRVYRETQVDGYIIAPPPGVEKEIRTLLRSQVPLVLFDRFFPDLPSFNVIVDNQAGCYEATRHFIARGHRNIALVTLDSLQVQMAERTTGYHKALEESGRTPLVRHIPFTAPEEERVRRIIAFIEDHPEVDAVLFSTNYLAISGIKAIQSLRRSIPGDLGVISFDDNTHFDLFTPSITSVAQPVFGISEAIMDLLWRQMDGPVLPRAKKETVVLPPLLMERNSVGRT